MANSNRVSYLNTFGRAKLRKMCTAMGIAPSRANLTMATNVADRERQAILGKVAKV